MTARLLALCVALLALTACMAPMQRTALPEPATLPTAASRFAALPTPEPAPTDAPTPLACPEAAPKPVNTPISYVGRSGACPGLVLVAFGEGFGQRAWIARGELGEGDYAGLPEAAIEE